MKKSAFSRKMIIKSLRREANVKKILDPVSRTKVWKARQEGIMWGLEFALSYLEATKE